MRILDIKLLRDLFRLRAQVLAIALVVAGGVATIILAIGSYRSLDETRLAYYERYRFADVFATVRRAPDTLATRIAEIPGVVTVETRITSLALLDIEGVREPATGEFISLPEGGEPVLNRLYLRLRRMPVHAPAPRGGSRFSPASICVSAGCRTRPGPTRSLSVSPSPRPMPSRPAHAS